MTDTQIEKIEKFLSGNMEPGEQETFQKELKEDKEFLAAFNTYHFTNTHMHSDKNYAGEDALKSSLSKLGDEFFNTEPKTGNDAAEKEQAKIIRPELPRTSTKKPFRLKNLQIWQIAAAILFGIIVLGTWYMLTNKKNPKEQLAINTQLNNGQLFTKYYKLDAAPKDQEGPLEDAFYEYEKRQFGSVVTAIENADIDSVATRGDDTDLELTRFYASYYKALSYIELKNDVEAIQLLKSLAAPDPFLQIKARWYLALAYLKTGNSQGAVAVLETISKKSEAGEYKLKAAELTMEIRKNN